MKEGYWVVAYRSISDESAIKGNALQALGAGAERDYRIVEGT